MRTDFWLCFLYGDDTGTLFNCWQYVQSLTDPSRRCISKELIVWASRTVLIPLLQIVTAVEGGASLTHSTSDRVIGVAWLEGLDNIKNNTNVFPGRISICLLHLS